MKPLIKKSDYESIKKILLAAVAMGNARDTVSLERELKNSEVLDDHLVNELTVRPGTKVEVLDYHIGNTLTVTIVPPHQANVTTGHISLLAPLAVALLGFQEGHEFDWTLPSGKRRFKIVKVTNE